MTIEIRSFARFNDPSSAIVAELDVYLPKMYLHLRRCRIIRTKNDNLFVGMPSYKDKETEAWSHYFEFEGSIQKKLAEEILEEAQKRLDQPESPADIPDAQTENIPF